MGEVQHNALGIDGFESKTSNDQLATPTLSPIAEHGLANDRFERLDDFNERHIAHSASRKAQTLPESNGASDTVKASKGIINGDLTSPTSNASSESQRLLKLSPRQIVDLTHSPSSLPLRSATPPLDSLPLLSDVSGSPKVRPVGGKGPFSPPSVLREDLSNSEDASDHAPALSSIRATPGAVLRIRPSPGPRSSSTPLLKRRESAATSRNPNATKENVRPRRPSLTPIKVGDDITRDANGVHRPSPLKEPIASPMPAVIPLPPLSLPTYLQLELSSERPSALYIHRPVSNEFPYESSKVKFERLLNFLLLPPELEQVLWFGALACLDAWLYTFTILPLRFIKAIWLLVKWWAGCLFREIYDVCIFIYAGVGRIRQRRREGLAPSPRPPDGEFDTLLSDKSGPESTQGHAQGSASALPAQAPPKRQRKSSNLYRHRRTKSRPSGLMPNHKADILHGLLIVISCMVLVRFDASRMYHSIRGQAAIKLYVIYNVLEVCDRLFSALGQDILECLFSKETLERKADGRSKVLRPFWMFVLALIYNVIHATMLFYQVVTLNVAVNSYSNALLTLLMSNQFVEIKGTVFKKFEKENLFQLTCADVVERFQLWLMLLIIALRNIIEVGGFSIGSMTSNAAASSSSFSTNSTSVPSHSTSIMPHAFTLISNMSGAVLSPFVIVLGSEMLVDWLKHAYINKFNSISPKLYSRFLDVMAKDYYSHAFADQNLTKRLGLPVLPLSCIFIRAAVQTYHMFLATHMPLPIPSPATSLTVEGAAATASASATAAALARIDTIFRRALGRSSFGAGGGGGGAPASATSYLSWTMNLDDMIALSTMVLFFLVLYLFLLVFKLVLGMALLNFARGRYKGMKERERMSYDTQSRRVGGWGVVEVDEDKRRWIYEGDEEGLRKLREREARDRERKAAGEGREKEKEKEKEGLRLEAVGRYMMAAKRIW